MGSGKVERIPGTRVFVTHPHGGKGDRQQREFCDREAHTESSLRLEERKWL